MERIFVVHGVQSVGRYLLCPELFPDGVCGQAKHVDFDVGAAALLRQELAGDDLDFAFGSNHAVYRSLGERIKLFVASTHELRLQHVPAVAVVFELALIQLHRQVRRLKVE